MSAQQTSDGFVTSPGCWSVMCMVCSVCGLQLECDSQKLPFSYHWCLQCFTTCPVQGWALVLIPFPQPRYGGRPHHFRQGGQTRLIPKPRYEHHVKAWRGLAHSSIVWSFLGDALGQCVEEQLWPKLESSHPEGAPLSRAVTQTMEEKYAERGENTTLQEGHNSQRF